MELSDPFTDKPTRVLAVKGSGLRISMPSEPPQAPYQDGTVRCRRRLARR